MVQNFTPFGSKIEKRLVGSVLHVPGESGRLWDAEDARGAAFFIF